MALDDLINPLLWRACLAGDVTQMEHAIAKGADPKVKDRNGENCLHMTARSGEVDALERMLDEGLHLDAANHNGQTALHVAVNKGHPGVTGIVLGNGQTALHVAVNKDHLGVVRFILRRGGDVNAVTKFSGMTGLHLACRDNNEDMVQCLLDGGANCAIKDKIGQYADHYTTNKTVLNIFEDHFPVCTHGRKPEEHGRAGREPNYTAGLLDAETDLAALYSQTPSHGPRGPTVINDEVEVSKAKGRKGSKDISSDSSKIAHQRRKDSDRSMGTYEDREHEEPEIYDKKENYDVDRDLEIADLDKKDGKKVKVNHAMGFSDDHKKRMQQNVFDRLMGKKGAKK